MNKLSECKINDKFIIKYIEGTEETSSKYRICPYNNN